MAESFASEFPNIQTVAMMGTYLPRRCGIATFSGDLAEAMSQAAPQITFRNVAMDDRPEGYRYPPRVWFEINESRRGEYRLAADFLNISSVDVVNVQHEYGIFGGPDGAHLLDCLQRLRIPVVTTMHTVLRQPSEGQRQVTARLAEVSDRLVVLSRRGVEFLRDIYGVDEQKIAFIPHGIPDLPFVDPSFYKDQFGVEGKKVILTFGLLSPNKGIEHMIDALPAVVERHPDAVYIVLGATHPHIRGHSGENYRTSLQRRTEQRGVADHVIFHNRFVEIDELCEFLGAADIYVTPYLSEAQIVSGTLAYAMGAGNAIISTPYWYAQEVLDEDRGVLVPFEDPEAMAGAINHLIEHEVERHAMRKRAYQFSRDMVWPRVARSYLELFATVIEQRRHQPHRAAVSPPRVRPASIDVEDVNLDHLRRMTDDCGVLRHAQCSVPRRASGYSVDDNARALLAMLQAQNFITGMTRELRELTARYISFLEHALEPESGRFRGVMSYDRRWQDEPGSEDSHARALWSLGETVARCQDTGMRRLAVKLFHGGLGAVRQFTSVRSWAFSVIGIHAYLRRFSGDSGARRLRERLAVQLFEQFRHNGSDDWPWPEQTLSYANARLPHALLLSGRWMFNNEMIEHALRSLDWLYNEQIGEGGHFSPIGCHGWYPRGGQRARFDQQPIEAQAMIDACLEAHKVTEDATWLDRAHRCFNWFLGDNDLGVPLVDLTTGGCHDGLHAHGVNENQGAEATLAWLLSLLAMLEEAHIDAGEKEEADPEAAEPDEADLAATLDTER